MRNSRLQQSGFTIVELLIVIVIIAVLAAVTLVAYNSATARSRDSARISKINAIAKAIEMYKIDNGRYPPIQDGSGNETSCGSQTENWGHCDRMKQLSDMLAPYMVIDPTSLSSATTGNYGYYYTSPGATNYNSYGMKVILEGNGGQNDGGYYSNAYEVGPSPGYCLKTYIGTSADWYWNSANTTCAGGN